MKGTVRYLAGIAGPSGFGSKSTAQQVTQHCLPPPPPSSSSPTPLTAIITGATSGIGEETATVLAKRGVRVVIAARDVNKASRLKQSILHQSPDAQIVVLELDLSSFASIASFSRQFLSLGLPLHILINNAGIYSRGLEFSEDKIEMTFATNYLGKLFSWRERDV
ncbi:unnamed protein product [Linum tenue]|uniref:Uncharacterized protein n=1 Tax=Linum tenue TaxID=586396 RepID=A0AAV0QRB4_9ROSI|nr:unnamed protein product [Linum tenue]